MDKHNTGTRQEADALRALLRADAEAAAPTPAQTREAMRALAPAIAAKSAQLKQRRKRRRELLLMLAVGVPFMTLMALAGLSLLRGDPLPLRALLIPLGALAGTALLLLPILEKFLISNN